MYRYIIGLVNITGGVLVSLGAVGCWTAQDIAIDSWSLITQLKLCNSQCKISTQLKAVATDLSPSTEVCTQCLGQTAAGHTLGQRVGE